MILIDNSFYFRAKKKKKKKPYEKEMQWGEILFLITGLRVLRLEELLGKELDS